MHWVTHRVEQWVATEASYPKRPPANSLRMLPFALIQQREEPSPKPRSIGKSKNNFGINQFAAGAATQTSGAISTEKTPGGICVLEREEKAVPLHGDHS